MTHVRRLHIGADHAGFAAKTMLIAHFRDAGLEVIDHGAFTYDTDDDYPRFCISAASAVIHDGRSLGIVIGGSGNGEQIAANKVREVRAALAWSVDTARLARQHNDANVLALGARMHDEIDLVSIADAFVSEHFEARERHVRRIRQIAEYEFARDQDGLTSMDFA